MQTKKIINWIFKYILFPLFPFFVGAATRIVHNNGMEFCMLNPAEIGYSMILLCCFMIFNAQKINDNETKQLIYNMYMLGVLLFMILFFGTIIAQTNLENQMNNCYDLAIKKASNEVLIKIEDIPCTDQINSTLNILRFIALLLGAITTASSIWIYSKYDLEKTLKPEDRNLSIEMRQYFDILSCFWFVNPHLPAQRF